MCLSTPLACQHHLLTSTPCLGLSAQCWILISGIQAYQAPFACAPFACARELGTYPVPGSPVSPSIQQLDQRVQVASLCCHMQGSFASLYRQHTHAIRDSIHDLHVSQGRMLAYACCLQSGFVSADEHVQLDSLCSHMQRCFASLRRRHSQAVTECKHKLQEFQ